jgi:hypothetical protein
MEKEYRISTGMQFFYGILAVGMFVFSVFLVFDNNPSVAKIVVLLPLAFAACAVLIFINLLRRKIVIDEKCIRCTSLFSTKQLALTDIKGSRVSGKAIELEPISAAEPTIVIGNYTDLKNSDQLASWAKDNFKDLNAMDLEAEKTKALQDPNLGLTEDERESQLKQKRTLATVYNIAGLAVGFLLIFLNALSATIILLLYPLAGILVMAFSKGVIKFVSSSMRSVHAFILLGFVLPCFILLIKSLGSYTVLLVNQLWLPGLGVGGVVFLLLYVFGINRSIKGIGAQVIAMAIPALLYGFGAVRMIDCAFDQSTPQIYNAGVLNRRIDQGRSTSYFLTLSSWGPRQEQETEVRRGVYRNTMIGDTVKVRLKDGLLHIPWFTVIEQ